MYKAKDDTNLIKNIQTNHNIKMSTKFKLISKILNKYIEILHTNENTKHLSKVIQYIPTTFTNIYRKENNANMTSEGKQITKVEQVARHNKCFWKNIRLVTLETSR